MLVRYEGPPDQVNHDVALAIAARRDDVEIELENQLESVDGDTVRATGTEPASALLEHGTVYDLPAKLATQLVATSAWWSRVTDFDKMTKSQLEDLAAEREIEGRSKMTKPELVKALRDAPVVPSTSDASTAEDAGVGSTTATADAAAGPVPTAAAPAAGTTAAGAATTAGGPA